MWIIEIIEAFGALPLAPLAIAGATAVTLATGGLIFSEHKGRHARTEVQA